MSKELSESEALKRFQDLIGDINVAMLTTVQNDGSLHSRPMATVKSEPSRELWFFSRKHSNKTGELERDQHVSVTYADTIKNRYVCVNGRGEVIEDKKRMQELWNPLYKAWFPKGLDDSELSLIKINLEHIEYWDSASSTMLHLFGIAKAVLQGKPADDSKLAEHKKLDMTG